MEKIDAKTAKEVLEKEQRDIIENCTKEINDVLSKYSCVLDASVIVTQKGNIPQVVVVPLPRS